MGKILAERIISGEEVSIKEIRGSKEPAVANALHVKDEGGRIPLDYLSEGAKQVFEKIKDLNLHGVRCPCWDCQSQLTKFPLD